MAVSNFFLVRKLIFGHFLNCKKWNLAKKNFVILIYLISRVFWPGIFLNFLAHSDQVKYKCLRRPENQTKTTVLIVSYSVAPYNYTYLSMKLSLYALCMTIILYKITGGPIYSIFKHDKFLNIYFNFLKYIIKYLL